MPSTQRSGRYLALRRPRIRRRGGRRAIVDVTASAWPPRPSAARNTKPPSPPSRRLCGAGSSHPRVQRGLRPAHVVSLHDLRSRRARYRDAHTHVRPWPNPVGWRDDAGRRGHQRQEPDRRRRRSSCKARTSRTSARRAGAPWRSKARPRTPSPAAATSAAAPGRLKPSSARYRTTPWRCRWAPLAAMPLSGKTPGATGIASPGPVLVASISLPGGTVVRTVSNPASIPDSQLFAVNNRPDAPISSPPTRASRASGPTCPATTCSTCCARPAACPDGQLGRRRRHAGRLAPGQLGCADPAGREVPHALGPAQAPGRRLL